MLQCAWMRLGRDAHFPVVDTVAGIKTRWLDRGIAAWVTGRWIADIGDRHRREMREKPIKINGIRGKKYSLQTGRILGARGQQELVESRACIGRTCVPVKRRLRESKRRTFTVPRQNRSCACTGVYRTEAAPPSAVRRGAARVAGAS